MAVLYDRVFPRSVDTSETVSQLTNAQIATAIIERVQAGKTWLEAELEVQSLACGTGARPVGVVKKIADKLREDIAALHAVDPRDYATAQDYKAALDAAAQYVPTSTYADYLQNAYNIPDGTAAERFAALLAVLPPKE